MWCLVSQPNSVILEIKVDPKAIGQECLEKVCEHLGIGAEADYFGLKISKCSAALDTLDSNVGSYSDGEDESSAEWVNLRNPMAAQRPRLRLRVKFWVPPHRLLLPATRHQFYLNARKDLLDGRMVVADWGVASRLVALIAQAEYGDCDPAAPPTTIYSQCQNIGPQKEKPIDYVQRIIDYHCEIEGMLGSKAEYQLLKEISNLESFGEELFFCKPSNPHNNNDAHSLYSHFLYHGKDENEVPSKNSNLYASQTVGCLTTGGGQDGRVEGCGCRLGMCVGVGPRGIMFYKPGNGIGDNENEQQSIPYTAIIRAAPVRRVFQLHYLNGEGRETELNIKMFSSRTAAALYRAVTEKHAFYCCETVRSDVTKQFIRDLKGTIISIFNEDSTLGKKYVFDIRRTYTEVYDNARRALFAAGAGAGNLTALDGCTAVNGHRRGSQCGIECRESRDRNSAQQFDALACRVCMDQAMDTLFMPCRHVLCCSECANKCTRCPLCRSEIEKALHIYLPVDISQKQ